MFWNGPSYEAADSAAYVQVRTAAGVVSLSPLAASMLFDRIHTHPGLEETTQRLHRRTMTIPDSERDALRSVLRSWLRTMPRREPLPPAAGELLLLDRALGG